MGGDNVSICGLADFFKCSIQYLVTKKVPRTFMSCIRSNLLGSICSVFVRLIAEALLIRISMPPKISTAFLIRK